MKTFIASLPCLILSRSASALRLSAVLLLVFACIHGHSEAAPKPDAPGPYKSSSSGLRWDNAGFSYSIPALNGEWTVKTEHSGEAQKDIRVAREVVSFSANADLTRIELTTWDKKRFQSLAGWYKWFGKNLVGKAGVTVRPVQTPSGKWAIWASIPASEQAHQAELFFITSDDKAFCFRYINQDEGANREAFKQLCFGFSPLENGTIRKGTLSEPIAAPVKVSTSKVASCGGVVDSCICGGNNPYPCCANGSNCTWGAWDRMCCNWGYAASNWGNAETWAYYAQAAGNYVQSAPTVGSVGCRTYAWDTPYGHVATVLQISGDNVYCIQMNCNVGGSGWSYQWFHKSYFTGGYITRTNPNPVSIVVDNTSGGFAASSGWATSAYAADKYGSNYRFKSTAAISDAATWTANIPSAGNYVVAAWWTAGSNRSSTAPYILPNNTTVHKNQTGGGGAWQTLGTVWLGTGNKTTKLSCWTTPGYVVVADAIRYTRQ